MEATTVVLSQLTVGFQAANIPLGFSFHTQACSHRRPNTGPAYSIKGSFLLTPLHTYRRFHALLRQMRLE
jgi:hypothetical protein